MAVFAIHILKEKMAKFKFPDPADYPPKTPIVICPGERVLNLYNQETGKDAQRLSKNVKDWFIDNARANGFADAHFVPEVETHHGAGCLLQVQGGQKPAPPVQPALSVVEVIDAEKK